MTPDALRTLLLDVQSGNASIEDALRQLRDLPYEDIGDARLDHHRHLRTGLPEVVYAESKTPDQVAEILDRLAQRGNLALATRARPDAYAATQARLPQAVYYDRARIIAVNPPQLSAFSFQPSASPRPSPPSVEQAVLSPHPSSPYVVVATGGTSDLPVAEEAAIIAELLGHHVVRLYDVGVAGLHRLLPHRATLYDAAVVIVVAGMEGALASVVGGLVACPVVAVPTSVGYGSAFGGLAALLSMLNACAPGIAVVNIDNGFGAAAFAHLIMSKGDLYAPQPVP
ncbi:MAG: nickel pincer cofactor biosynthesis protein LarB [Anaerolineae bacterium]|nr:nickel pincer cofactor biosynthesis protein LarB [Anaerolineae bacterium]